MSKCDVHMDLLTVMDAHKKDENKILGWDVSLIDIDDKNLKLMDKVAIWLMKKNRGKKHPVNSTMLDKAIKKLYGKKNERINIATKINAMLTKHPDLKDIFENEVMLKITKMEGQQKLVTRSAAGPVVDLNAIPIRVLRNLYHFLNDVVAHGKGEGVGTGAFGTVQAQFTTPRKMAQKEASGALFTMRKKVRDFAADQANQLARFIGFDFKDKHMVADPDNPTKRIPRDYGYDDIMKEVQSIAEDPSLAGVDMSAADKKQMIVDIFIRHLTRDDFGNRRLQIDENGDMSVATVYNETKESWEEGGADKKYSYGGYKSYTEVYTSKDTGEFGGLPLSPELLKKLEREAFKFDELHTNLWETLQGEFKESQKELYNELHSLFEKDGVRWEDKDIESLFFKENPEDYDKFLSLTPEQQAKVKFIHKNATRYNILKPFVFNARNDSEIAEGVSRGRRSFPVVYEQFNFSRMWDDMIAKYEFLLKEAEDTLADKNLDILIKHRMQVAVGRYKSILKRGRWIRDRKDDYPVDMNTGTMLSLGVDSKHMDHISNAFNILEQRTDEGAYYSYLQHNFAMLQRNKLSTQLIKSLKMAKSEAVEDYIVNMYKVALYQPDTKSGFLWLKLDSDSISKNFGRVGIHITPAKIDRKMRILLSYLSGNLLRGFPTAIQNFTAVIQKTIDMGTERVLEAYKILSNDTAAVKKIISLSGVVDFREFFSRGLTNDARNLGGSRNEAMRVTVAMIEYWKAVDKLPKSLKGKALAERKKKLRTELEGKVSITFKAIPSKERLTKRQKLQKDEMRTAVLRKWVDFAINKEYEANPYVKNIIYQKGAGYVEIYAKFVQEHLPTMGKTESTLRALSFIIGVRAAMDKGYLPKKDFSELTPDELEQAIEIGREYTEMLDFGMSRQDLGQVGHSNVGSFMTQFKVWSFQKMSKDLDTFRDAYRELKDVDAEWFDFKAGLQMFAELVPFRNQKAMRTASPAIAAFRSFLYTQGIWTAIWDFAIMGPILVVPGLRKLAFLVPGVRAVGGSTSDLVSLMLLIPGIALALSQGAGDDEWEKILDYYSRKTIFGFGSRWTIDHILLLVAFLSNADAEEKADALYKSGNALLPPPLKEIAPFLKPQLEEFLE